MEDVKNQNEGRVLERFQAREWAPGDVYSPHDLSPNEMKKWSKRWSPSNDAFDALNIKPLEHYKVQTHSGPYRVFIDQLPNEF
jgi:small subunit ribosomal protein S18